MKPEARFWQSMSKALPVGLDRLDRIENSVGVGQPDVNGCLDGEDVWIELKAPQEPVRDTTAMLRRSGNHELLTSQIGWFIRQGQAGGIAFILIRTQHRILLINGCTYAKKINDYTLPQLRRIALFECAVPTKQEDWRMLRNVIITATRHRRVHHHTLAQERIAQLERQTLAGDSRKGQRSGKR